MIIILLIESLVQKKLLTPSEKDINAYLPRAATKIKEKRDGKTKKFLG